MKRSKMIEKLSYFIAKTEYITAEDILDLLEENGMTPPYNPNATLFEQMDNRTMHFWEAEKESSDG